MDFGLKIGFSLGFVDDKWSDWCYVVLLLTLDDLDVLLLIWMGFDLLVLEIYLGWNSMYLVEFVLWEMLEKKIFWVLCSSFLWAGFVFLEFGFKFLFIHDLQHKLNLCIFTFLILLKLIN